MQNASTANTQNTGAANRKRLTKMLILSKFQIRCLLTQYIVFAATLLLQFSISLLVGHFAKVDSGSLDFPMLAMSAAFGALVFSVSYRYAILNGLTRKMYFITAMLSCVILALGYALFTFLLMTVTHNAPHSSTDLFFLLFDHPGLTVNYGALFLFLFGGALCMSMLAHLVAAVLYRTRTRGKLYLLGGLLVAGILLTGIHYLTNGALGQGLLTALKALFGFASEIPNPFIPFATFLGLSALLAAGSFLLLRRTDLRN